MVFEEKMMIEEHKTTTRRWTEREDVETMAIWRERIRTESLRETEEY